MCYVLINSNTFPVIFSFVIGIKYQTINARFLKTFCPPLIYDSKVTDSGFWSDWSGLMVNENFKFVLAHVQVWQTDSRTEKAQSCYVFYLK